MFKLISIQNKPCVCGSGKIADSCCLGIIMQRHIAETAEQLMRSRYTAYACGQTDYILRSWHSSTRPAQISAEAMIEWIGLKIVSASQPVLKGESRYAQVEFIAHFLNSGVAGQMHERSRFVQEQGEWYYLDGEQIDSDTQLTSQRPGRNDPCSCGSGKKFKKCCGKN